MTKTTTRTNIHISAESRAILSALGAASTGKPTLAGGLAELIARVTDGITTHPTQPGKPATTSYRGAWTNAEGEKEETEFAYPDRPSAIAAAVLLRFEEGRARALAAEPPDNAARRVWCCYSGTAGIVLSDRDNPQHTANGRYLGDFMGTWAEAQAWAAAQDEAAEVAAEQEHGYNAIIRESLRMP